MVSGIKLTAVVMELSGKFQLELIIRFSVKYYENYENTGLK